MAHSNKAWKSELKTAIDLYNEGDFSGCIAHVSTVSRDTTPGYPRTRYYALLACCTDKWREAEASRVKSAVSTRY
jgi:hypothetical protein